MTATELEMLQSQIMQIIDDLKGLMATHGLSNQAAEENIVTTVFLYKFLNDKFFYNLEKFAEEFYGEATKEERQEQIEEILNNEDMLDAFYEWNSLDVAFRPEETIQYFVNHIDDTLYDRFDKALKAISDNPRNEQFSLTTAEGTKKPLLEPISGYVEAPARNNFVRNILSYISTTKMDPSGKLEKNRDFDRAYDQNFDFYSTIFEYLIKDYNVAAGKYAEYFTPAAISSIIAKILVGMSEQIKGAEIYDPSAGSGSLVLHLAHELGQDKGFNRATVYTQDISNKSTRFLRLNLILNGLSQSLATSVQGDTLLSPAHLETPGNPDSGLKKFDYITSNPPFKMDFSSTRNDIEQRWESTDRFFAGIPKIPAKKKDSMAVYLPFIEHIIYSLKPDGKAAVVVPTGFLTAQSGIEKKVRQKLIDEKMLRGAISMPANIFANTGTNVSVIFIDKANTEGEVTLIDASKMGEKRKEGKYQRTFLRQNEIDQIIDTFNNQEQIDDFSVNVSYGQIKEKNYSLSAGQYFEVKIEYVPITATEFADKMSYTQKELSNSFSKGREIEDEIVQFLRKLAYET